MKVTLVNKHYRLGGIETIVNQLLRGLRVRGFETELWISEFGDLPTDSSVHFLYPRILHRMQHSRLAGFAEQYFPRRRWTEREFRKMRRCHSDVIHIHGFDETYARIEVLVELANAKPVVVTLHGTWFFTGGCGQPLGCDRYTKACGQCPQAGVWPVAPSDNTAEELERKRRLLADAPIHFVAPAAHMRRKALESSVGKKWQISHFPNGVDPNFFRGEKKHDRAARQAYGIDPRRFVVLAMCRDFRDPVKGTPLMLGALQLLESENVQVILAGAFAELTASKIPKSLRPTAVGYVSNDAIRRDLFEIADVFLFASLAETFPCVVLEAMSSECCVVSTPLEGVQEQLHDGESGILAEGFTSDALAQALTHACQSEDRTREIGRRARAEVLERFTEENMFVEHEALYRRVAE